ncbi:MAG: tRNA 4-thiouridine(8) synthase ThiI [Firmicutes bacterium]|nr:tRNA 4-thiouridine(8) synthase ThiI [Bacillota bacterium]
MENIYIVRCGESALKGKNKPYFERMLVQRIKKNLKDEAGVTVERVDGLIFVRTPEEIPQEDVLKRVGRVFGVDSISPAVEVPIEGLDAESALDAIGREAVAFMMKQIEVRGIKTFKVDAKRADKTFAIQSPDIGKRIGARVLKGCKVLKVDVHEPDCFLYINVRRNFAYLYDKKIAGYGGLPLGTNGRGMVLLSGGIDSPVATFMMAHRGMYMDAVHFHSYPYTSERAFEKVKELAGILTDYCGRIRMFSINLLPIQEQIVQNCPEEETTILVRRFMMRIAEAIAKREGDLMLITGESLGQVASQTAASLVVTDAAVSLPVMRPLIAMDKTQIMDIARDIGTFETSIQPYEDCCTVFLPKHPVTQPKLERIEASESRLDVEALVSQAVESAELIIISQREGI